MPIVSSIFDYKRPQRNGTWNVREHHIDSVGRHYYFPYKADSEADADTRMAVRDGVAMIRESEEKELEDHIEQGGTPDNYTATELSSVQKRRHALKRFMKNDITDREFICRMADFVGGFTVAQIESAAQISTAKATVVRNRAIRLRDVICPALDLDDVDVG